MRVGLAGRSAERLGDVRAQLGAAASRWPLLVADSCAPSSLAALANATRVVATTVGPYRPHGLTVVEACVAAATDYVDLSGEVLFIRDSIDSYHATAARTGTRIVHSCGVDSIPSDSAVLLLHQAALADGAGDLEDTTLVVRALQGWSQRWDVGFDQATAGRDSGERSARKVVEDPYALSPDRAAEPELGDERDLAWIKHEDDLGMWVGPFLMAGINTRVVRRSNALRNWPTAADSGIGRSLGLALAGRHR